MKIERIEAIPVRLPYRTPVHFALGVLNSAEHVVIRVYADNGIVGVAITTVTATAWEAAGQFSHGCYRFALVSAFFGVHSTALAMGVMVVLLVLIALTIRSFRRVHRTATMLMLPYGAWCLYAAYLSLRWIKCG